MLQPFRLAQPQSLGLYSYFLCPRSVTFLVALLWILFSISSLRPHTWTRCSRCLMHAKQREGSLLWPAGHSLAKAAQYVVNLCCCRDKLLTRIQLVLHQHSSPNQLHQQSWKVLSSSLGDYILLPSVCRCCQTGGWRKGICRCFLCSTPFFFFVCFLPDFSVMPWKPSSLAHASKPEPLPSFRRREGKQLCGWGKWRVGLPQAETLNSKHPFLFGLRRWGLASFQLICVW